MLAGALPPQKKLASKETKPPVLPTAQAAVQIAAIPEAASAGGRIPIVMPEKLAKGRFLVELETIDGGATDLTGDAGAVGRFSHSGKKCRLLQKLLQLKEILRTLPWKPKLS